MASNIEIKNKKADHLYELTDEITAGMQLYGTEIKSIRQGKASLADSFCFFIENELYVKMHITEYSHGTYNNHEAKRERKLLLTKRELKKLRRKTKIKGFTIVPIRLFINERGYAKLEIALAKGKRAYDKRQDLKTKDTKREMDRMMKF
jgi:SsrA-binding protein